MSIAVIGTIFVDVKGIPYADFIPDGRNPGYMLNIHGGVGRNVAEDLANLGFDARLAALTDKSALAHEVISRLENSGVDTRFVKATDAGMGTWMAIFNEKGDVAASISVRPDLSPLTGLLEKYNEEIFADADSIILEIDIEEAAAEKVFEYARKYGKNVYALVSVMSIALERRKYFPQVECFICNLQEAGMLCGRDLPSEDIAVIEDAALECAKKEGFGKLIITLGDKGCVFADTRTGETGHCPAENVEMIDSTGAGDSFCAAAAAALTYGGCLYEACKEGCRTAAKVIQSTENVVTK